MITWTKNLTEVVKALNDLLKCPMPHDLLDIRKEVKEQYGGEDEDAKEDMDVWCAEDFALKEVERHYKVKHKAQAIVDKYKDLL